MTNKEQNRPEVFKGCDSCRNLIEKTTPLTEEEFNRLIKCRCLMKI